MQAVLTLADGCLQVQPFNKGPMQVFRDRQCAGDEIDIRPEDLGRRGQPSAVPTTPLNAVTGSLGSNEASSPRNSYTSVVPPATALPGQRDF